MKINKKLKIFLITLVAIIVIPLIIFFALICNLTYKMFVFDYLSQEKMTEVLTENWDLLNETVEELKPLFYDDSIEKAWITSGIFQYYKKENNDKIKLKHFLLLEVYDEGKKPLTKEKLPKEKFEKLNNSKAYKILKKSEFKGILYKKVGNDCIYFVNRSTFSFGVYLAYSENGKPQDEYIRTWEHIKGNWYYCMKE